jgi:hypothetical protein
MDSSQEARKAGCLLGTIGLIAGLLIGFLFDAMMEPVTGRVRRGFGTDLGAAMIKAYVGGVIGLVGGQLLAMYLNRRR